MEQKIVDIISEILAPPGRLLGSSKGRYVFNNPKNVVYFNANIYTQEGKYWYGDIDVTLELEKLQKIAINCGKTIYVLSEMDGRFENENKALLYRAAIRVDQEGNYIFNEGIRDYIELVDDQWRFKDVKPEEDTYRETYNADNYEPLTEFPNPRKFISRDSHVSPYEKFYLYLADQIGGLPKGYTIDVTKVFVSKEVSDKLKELTANWIRRYYTDDDYDVQKELTWLSFDIGPHEFTHHEDWMKPNYVYQNGELFKKRGE